MRKAVNFVFAAVAIFVASPQDSKALPSASLVQERNSISGFVFDEARRPVSTIYVELLNDTYSTVARIRTRGSGMFAFTGLQQGQYNVRVMTAGTDFEEQTRVVNLVPFSVVQGRGVAIEQVDFYLRAKRSVNTPRTGVPGVVFLQEVPATAKTLYEAGLADLAEKNETAGLDKIKKSIEIFPDYYLALDRLGYEYLTRGYHQAAFVLLSKAVAVNPRSFTSTFGLGLAEYRLGRTDQALNYFKTTTEIDKTSANGHLWLGIGMHAKKKLSDALASLTKADELSGGTSAEVHWQLARVYKDLKRFGKAADELELFLKYKPDAKNFGEIKQMVGSLRLKK